MGSVSAIPTNTRAMYVLLTKILGLSAAASVPVGAGAYALRNKLSPEVKMPSPIAFASLPLIPGVGPKREKISAAPSISMIRRLINTAKGIGNTLKHPVDTAKAFSTHVKKYPKVLTGGTAAMGAAVGSGAGYGLTQRFIEQAKEDDINRQLAAREREFDALLLQEQLAARGLKSAEVLDNLLESVFDAEIEKNAANVKMTAEMYNTLGSLLGLSGLGYGAYVGWTHTIEGDKNRAIVNALRQSLEQRLTGNPEGPKAPMVVKMKTQRVGSTPIPGNGNVGSSRDILSRI